MLQGVRTVVLTGVARRSRRTTVWRLRRAEVDTQSFPPPPSVSSWALLSLSLAGFDRVYNSYCVERIFRCSSTAADNPRYHHNHLPYSKRQSTAKVKVQFVWCDCIGIECDDLWTRLADH